MKNKDYSNWQVAGFAYAISLGTMDLNIIKDSWSKINIDKTE